MLKSFFLIVVILFCGFKISAQVNDAAKITLNLSSSKIFVGGKISLSGESGQLKTIKTVKLKVQGPRTLTDEKVDLIDGIYKKIWTSTTEGQYTITAFSSDGKDSIAKKVNVVALNSLATMASKNMEVATKAEKKLEEAIDKATKQLSNDDVAKLKSKFGETKTKLKALQKFYTNINEGGKQFAKNATESEKTPDINESLSALTRQLENDQMQMQKFLNNTHKPTDITICELLVLINEAAALFSTVTNIASFPLSACKMVKSIALDKAVPYTVDVASEGSKNSPSATESSAAKAGSKFFGVAAVDGTSLMAQIGNVGFVGDLISYISDILLKKYCGILKAKVVQDHKADFKNSSNESWWMYSFKTESILNLRYPKNEAQGNIVKMKGNIEGNATDFKFFSDANKNDDFKKDSKGRNFAKNTFFKKPLFVPFATSEKDVLGFGAVARAVATPAYFNIPVDAELNRNTNTLRLFLNLALIDFTDMVATRVFYFEFIPFPFVFIQAYPYEKVFNSMNAVVKRSKGIKVIYDSKGGLTFKDVDKFNVGQGTNIEIEVKLSIIGKQEN